MLPHWSVEDIGYVFSKKQEWPPWESWDLGYRARVSWRGNFQGEKTSRAKTLREQPSHLLGEGSAWRCGNRERPGGWQDAAARPSLLPCLPKPVPLQVILVPPGPIIPTLEAFRTAWQLDGLQASVPLPRISSWLPRCPTSPLSSGTRRFCPSKLLHFGSQNCVCCSLAPSTSFAHPQELPVRPCHSSFPSLGWSSAHILLIPQVSVPSLWSYS